VNGALAPDSSPARWRFGQLVAREECDVDLAEAALLIASEEYPGLDVGRYLSQLDVLGDAARQRIDVERELPERVRALSAFLGDVEGFRGNRDDYYDPRNSYLNEVLDRKVGIPITLSTVYIEVGRRAGLPVDGVSFPGHFLVKVATATGDLVVDPFHGGRLLTAADCQNRLDRVYAGKVQLEASMLEPAGTRQMLARMLRNLKSIYVRRQELPRALAVLDLLLVLDRRSPDDLRDRGLLHAALDCYGRAAEDLEAYLTLQPDAAEAAALSIKIVELRRRAARLN
jgi:regulator of sirC expression with transglutaminase-like and TPR domain